MSVRHRKAGLVLALLLTLILTVYVSKMEGHSEEIVSSPISTPSLSGLIINKDKKENTTTNVSDSDFIRNISEPVQDVFEVPIAVENKPSNLNSVMPTKAFHQKVPLTPLNVVIFPPSAPPLPFKYLGKYNDEDGLVIFLIHNGKNLIVKNGDIIQQTYRVEEIKPPMMTLTYLPMEIKQIINIGEMN